MAWLYGLHLLNNKAKLLGWPGLALSPRAEYGKLEPPAIHRHPSSVYDISSTFMINWRFNQLPRLTKAYLARQGECFEAFASLLNSPPYGNGIIRL
jgi:hypothetical protein